MPLIAILALILLTPMLEVVVLVAIAPHLGFWGTIGLLAASFVVGVLMVVWQGRESVHRMRTAMDEGRLALDAAGDSVLIFFAGVLLIVPGILTDIVAFLLLIPFTRDWIKRGLAAWFRGRIVTETYYQGPDGEIHRETSGGDLIDSYVVRREETSADESPHDSPEITYDDESERREADEN